MQLSISLSSDPPSGAAHCGKVSGSLRFCGREARVGKKTRTPRGTHRRAAAFERRVTQHHDFIGENQPKHVEKPPDRVKQVIEIRIAGMKLSRVRRRTIWTGSEPLAAVLVKSSGMVDAVPTLVCATAGMEKRARTLIVKCSMRNAECGILR